MHVILNTETSFLEKNLSYLERVLLGTFAQHQDPARAGYQAQFSFQPQPAVSLAPQEAQAISLTPQEAQAELPAIAGSTSINSSRFQNIITNFLNYFLGLLMLGASVVLIVFYGPSLYQAVFPDRVEEKPSKLAVISAETYKYEAEQKLLTELKKAEQDEAELVTPAQEQPRRYLPAQNPDLPQGDWLIIPLIGVHTNLQRTTTAEEALETGVWWVPEFGEPGQLDEPMIVSGHRYGWKWWWRDDYWRYHSFYKLPELQPGDRVEIISDQRKWIYEIYSGEQGEEITDYQADLILYTCKFLNSPLRIFRYAKLIVD